MKSEEEVDIGSRESTEVVVLGAGEGCKVVEFEVETRESSVSDVVGSSGTGDGAREEEGGCRERIVCVIWLCENGLVRLEASGFVYSATVSRIALVISSWLVYEKQIFNIASPFPFVSSTALSMDSKTSGLTSSRWPSTRMQAP